MFSVYSEFHQRAIQASYLRVSTKFVLQLLRPLSRIGVNKHRRPILYAAQVTNLQQEVARLCAEWQKVIPSSQRNMRASTQKALKKKAVSRPERHIYIKRAYSHLPASNAPTFRTHVRVRWNMPTIVSLDTHRMTLASLSMPSLPSPLLAFQRSGPPRWSRRECLPHQREPF